MNVKALTIGDDLPLRVRLPRVYRVVDGGCRIRSHGSSGLRYWMKPEAVAIRS